MIIDTYIITRKSDGIEVGRYNSDVPVEWTGWEFVTHDHIALPVQQPPVVIPPVYEWEPFVFLRKFTQTERIACEEASKTNAVLNDFFNLLKMAPLVHSNDADMIAGMGYLVYLGIITDARKTEILGTP